MMRIPTRLSPWRVDRSLFSGRLHSAITSDGGMVTGISQRHGEGKPNRLLGDAPEVLACSGPKHRLVTGRRSLTWIRDRGSIPTGIDARGRRGAVAKKPSRRRRDKSDEQCADAGRVLLQGAPGRARLDRVLRRCRVHHE